MRDAKSALDAANASVLIVSFEGAATLRKFGWFRNLPFNVVSDSSRQLYGAFGLRSRPLRQLLDRKTIASYLRGIVHGRMPRLRETDFHQLGGDVVLNSDGEPTFIYRSSTPADRPSVELLVRMLLETKG